MSREEIINTKAYQTTKAATIYYNQHLNDSDIDLMDAFEAGAKWAEKATIERAYKWVKENFENYVGVDVSEYYIYDDAFADDFLKAMKE